MAANKTAVSFDEIIQNDRQRRKNEALAQRIFGKGRRASAPGQGATIRKPGTGPSLASRVGVAKRSFSSSPKPQAINKGIKTNPSNLGQSRGNVNSEWTHDLHEAHAAPSSFQRRGRAVDPVREARFNKAISGSAGATSSQFNIVGNSKGPGISIRGLAGPARVWAQNFAPGTTAADIESAMAPIGGKILKCIVIASRPTVVAEIIFETREGADNAIDTFNNQTADGRILHVYLKSGNLNLPSTMATGHPSPQPSITPPSGPRADLLGKGPHYTRYASQQSQSRERKVDNGEVQDGSYGFEDRMDTDTHGDEYESKSAGQGRGLYSDSLLGSRNANLDRGRGRVDSRDERRGGRREYR